MYVRLFEHCCDGDNKRSSPLTLLLYSTLLYSTLLVLYSWDESDSDMRIFS